MSTSAQHVISGHSKLICSPSCVICKCDIINHLNHAWDIPQAYEMMSRTKLMKDVKNLLQISERSRLGIQQVFKCAKAVSCHTRSFHRDRDDSVVIASRTIARAVQAYLEFRTYRIGNMLLKQKDGTPIGGFLSSTLLNLHLATAENNFLKYEWPKLVKKHGLCQDFYAYISPSRYEDDLHCCSRSICHACVSNIVKSAYSGRLPFDPSDDFLHIE
eukprot:1873023-Karenia_brevis.AAC.1